ncbi:MAG TPA: hypothetical protein VN442_01480 [Bryobacteraceae bacterium]|nr:hypothetical protein [Bryobacteraceae bacterium]
MKRLSGPRAIILLDCLLILILAAALVKPLFQAKYLDRWGSIESTFIADSRFLKENWPHPRWQPLWYCGTRFDYVYPPALRYGTAAVMFLLPVPPVKAYHIYTAFFFAIGIAAVYLLARVGSGSRGVGWLSAAAAALLSPAFLFMRAVREDSTWLMPQRLGVLVRYGEGPHITSLAWLPLALVCAWIGLRSGRPLALAAAAVAGAMVVSTNFYGATTLAMFYPVLVWSIWITHQDRRIWLRAAAVPVLAYGLTAFWLVPSYLVTTLRNMRYVSHQGNLWSVGILAAVAVAYLLATNKFARGKPGRAWPVFVAGSVALFALNVLGNAAFGFRVIGEPHRLVPELDMLLILGAVEVLRRMWNLAPGRLRQCARVAAVLVVAVSFWTARGFLRHAWELYSPDCEYQKRIEYRAQDWMARNMPDARAMVSGSVRFWYNAWNSLAQVGGGSEQGLKHDLVIPASWEIHMGQDPQLAVAWLVSLGADVIVVHDKQSQEMYHDHMYPGKFAGVLDVAWDDGQGNVIYRVPRRSPGLARVVDRAQARALKPPESQVDLEGLKTYLAVVEHGPGAPASTAWEGTDALIIRAKTEPGQDVLVQVTHDTAWHAYSDGRPLPIRRDVMDFMLVETPPGEHEIRLVFELPFENAAGRALSVLSALAVLLLVIWDRRAKAGTRSPAPAAGPSTN